MHRFLPSGKKRKAAFLLASVLPAATAAVVSLSGCGSGSGTSPAPPNVVLPSGLLPSPSASATPAPTVSPVPTASASPTPTPTASPTTGGSAAYTVTTIGQPSDGRQVFATDFNTAGQAVGYATRSGVSSFIAYTTTNGTFAEIGALSGQNAVPHTISDSGQILGRALFPSGRVQNAFVLTNGTARDLGNLGGSSDAYAINRSGQVVGNSYFADVNSLPHAFLYENGTMRDLGTLGNGNSSRADDINDAGVIVGSASVSPNTGSHPMIYENNQMREIPAIGGGSQSGTASAINNRGQVVGQSSTGSANRPFLYENGVTRDLGTFGGTVGAAIDINEAGVIVGYSSVNGTEHHAFVYQNNTLVDLHGYSPYPEATSDAIAINENGQILVNFNPIKRDGSPNPSNATTQTFVLTPVTRQR